MLAADVEHAPFAGEVQDLPIGIQYEAREGRQQRWRGFLVPCEAAPQKHSSVEVDLSGDLDRRSRLT
jgi:hypothetical protein